MTDQETAGPITRRTRVLRRHLPVLFAILALGGGCDSPTGVCTQIGCDSGLTVQLDQVPTGAFTVEVLPEEPQEHPVVYRVECAGSAAPCGARVFFPGLVLERARVRVTTTLGTVTHDATDVIYRTSYPNGRQCTPACRQATVDVTVPR